MPGSRSQNASALNDTGLILPSALSTTGDLNGEGSEPPGGSRRIDRYASYDGGRMPTVRSGTVIRLGTVVRLGTVTGLAAQAALLGVLAGTVGLKPVGWLLGLAYGFAVNLTLARGLAAGGEAGRLGPANTVTLARATLVGGVTALVGDALTRPISGICTRCARRPRHCRARARRRRWPGSAAHQFGDGARGAVRYGNRRLSHLRVELLRRSLVGTVDSRDRPRSLRVRCGRLGSALATTDAAGAPLVQDCRRHSGHRVDGGGSSAVATGVVDRRARRRPGAVGGVVRARDGMVVEASPAGSARPASPDCSARAGGAAVPVSE